MKILYNDYGDESVLQEADIQKHEVKNNQIRIEITDFAINYIDMMMMSGKMQKLPLPADVGSDLSGTVAEVGSSVSGLKQGDSVIAHVNSGAYASEIVTEEDNVAKKPDDLSPEQGAALPLAAITAYNALKHKLNVEKGKCIVIEGAAGGVGSIAIQAAKKMGLTVLAVDSSTNEEEIKDLGADEFYPYDKVTAEDIQNATPKADYTLNAVNGGHESGYGLSLLKKGSDYLSLTSTPSPTQNPDYHFDSLKPSSEWSTKEALEFVTSIPSLKVEVGKVFSFTLDNVKEAQKAMQNGVSGKVVIKVK